MGFVVVGFLAILGAISTLGLVIFHLLVIVRKDRRLSKSCFYSMLAACVGVFVIFLGPVDELLKPMIFYTIILNHVLAVVMIYFLSKRKAQFFPADTDLRKSNVAILIFYAVSMANYLIMTYAAGIDVAMDAV